MEFKISSPADVHPKAETVTTLTKERTGTAISHYAHESFSFSQQRKGEKNMEHKVRIIELCIEKKENQINNTIKEESNNGFELYNILLHSGNNDEASATLLWFRKTGE